MSCEEFWNRMPELESGSGARIVHIAECAACAARLAERAPPNRRGCGC